VIRERHDELPLDDLAASPLGARREELALDELRAFFLSVPTCAARDVQARPLDFLPSSRHGESAGSLHLLAIGRGSEHA
jgi:hypothetical protein